MTWLKSTRAYLYSAAAFLGIALMWLLKYLVSQNAKLKIEKKIEKARADHARKVMESDKDIDEQADVHLADAVNEINESGSTDELAKPNKDWK